MALKRKCDVMKYHSDAVDREPGYAELRRQLETLRASSRRAPLTSVTRIPVVVHVVYANEEQNVSEQQIHEQIKILNQDFRSKNIDISNTPAVFQPLIADALIEFQLAVQDPTGKPTTGILRYQTTTAQYPVASVPPNTARGTIIDPELKLGSQGAVAWPRDDYLNIWICNMGGDPLGYAAWPASAAWRDGIVIDYRAFGRSGTAEYPFDGGRTATHEIGHWLNLLHIWGDDNGACSHSDNISDTPNQASANEGLPVFPSISCNNGPNGDLFMNFMDYVNDGSMVMFTKGQVARMHAALQGPRAGILQSQGLQAANFSSLGSLHSARMMIAHSSHPEQLEQMTDIFDGVTWVPINE